MLALAGLVGTARAAPAPPLRFGLSLDQSGRFAAFGDMQLKAYRQWQDEVNAQGGILGRSVELVVRDDAGDTAKAQQHYAELIGEERVDFVFGPYSSAITAAVAPIVEKAGYPLVCSGGTSDEIFSQGHRHVVALSPPASRYTIGFLALLADAKLTSLAVIALDEAFPLNAAQGTRRWAERYGLRIASYTVLPRRQPLLEPALKAARRSGAQALVLAGYLDEAVQARQLQKQMGWQPVYYATVGPALPQYREQLGDAADGTFSTSLWEPRTDVRFPDAKRFHAAFTARWGMPPSYHAASAYAAGQVLEAAIKRAGGFDRAKVTDALYALDINTIVGRFALDRNGMQSRQAAVIVQWQGAQREVVWPPEAATATAVMPAPSR